MKRILLTLAIVAMSPAGHGEKGQSIMFGDPDPIYQEKSPDRATAEHEEHCRQLRRQMDELKGKPQRRHAASERFKIECQAPGP